MPAGRTSCWPRSCPHSGSSALTWGSPASARTRSPRSWPASNHPWWRSRRSPRCPQRRLRAEATCGPLATIASGFKLASGLSRRQNALVLSRGDYHWQHEPILYGWKPGAPHRWYGARDKTTILEFGAPPFQQVGEQEWQIVLGETTLIVRGE